MIKAKKGAKLTGQDPEAARELFLNEIMSELNLEGEALQVRKQETEGCSRKKEQHKQRTCNMKQQDACGKLRPRPPLLYWQAAAQSSELP